MGQDPIKCDDSVNMGDRFDQSCDPQYKIGWTYLNISDFFDFSACPFTLSIQSRSVSAGKGHKADLNGHKADLNGHEAGMKRA